MVADETSNRLAPIGDENRAAGDQDHTEPVRKRKPFAEKEDRKHCNKDDAELVDRRNTRRIADLQRAEIADPGCAGCKPERIRKSHVRGVTVAGLCQFPVM